MLIVSPSARPISSIRLYTPASRSLRSRNMALRNIDTIDAGVPVLSMHSPFETTAKFDCYMTYKTMKAAYQAK